MQVISGLDLASQALRAVQVDGISRSWSPGESVQQLREQHQVAKIAVQKRLKS